jgi:hypothetical protein
MSWLDRLAALPPRRLAVATGVAAICGLAGVVIGLAGGMLPMAIASYAVLLGAGLLPAVMDWRKANAAVEAV